MTWGIQTAVRSFLLCRSIWNRSCHPPMVLLWAYGGKSSYWKSASLGLKVLPFSPTILLQRRHLSSSQGILAVISFCRDEGMTLLFHTHSSPGLRLLLSTVWVPCTKRISFLFLPYWAWDEVIYLWLMRRSIQPTAGRRHLHCMNRVILWCLGIARVWSSYHGLTRCSACTELWKVFMYALSPQQIWGNVT